MRALAQAAAPQNVVPGRSLSGVMTPGREACSGARASTTMPSLSTNRTKDRGVAAADTLSSRADRAARRQGLTDLTAVAAVTAMRNGDLKAEDYARALLDRAQHLESLNAFRTLDKEMLLEAARAADKMRASGDALGTLHGLPIPVKDSINSKALPTSNGTRHYATSGQETMLECSSHCWRRAVSSWARRISMSCRTAGRATTSSSDPFTTPMTRRACLAEAVAGPAPPLPPKWRRWPSPRIPWDRFASPPQCVDWQGCALASAVTRAMGSCRSRMPSLIRLAPWRVRLETLRCSMRR